MKCTLEAILEQSNARTTLFWWHGSVRGHELLVKGGAGLEVDCKAA